MAIPRYRRQAGPALFSAGFRPFFLAAAAWSATAIPLWLLLFAGQTQTASALPPAYWHAHEMVFGYGAAVVAGFLLTAIPNWTGHLPLQGRPLMALVLLWLLGRIAVLFSATIGAPAAAVVDLAFPLVFLAVVGREVLAGRNWRNLPMLAALFFLLLGNLLVHLESIGIAATAPAGNRLGIATLLMLISLVGGRIIPSFTGNWLAKQNPGLARPVAFNAFDRGVLMLTALALVVWVSAPDSSMARWLELAAGLALGLRLARWRGIATLREPLLWILHLGYGWLALGFILLGLTGLLTAMPQTAALHALTAGAIGTMTLAMMTRTSLSHTGRPLTAGAGITTIYGLVTVATLLRLLAPFGSEQQLVMLSLAGAAWSAAFAVFILIFLPVLTRPRGKAKAAVPAASSR